jgi:hypothetical protein
MSSMRYPTRKPRNPSSSPNESAGITHAFEGLCTQACLGSAGEELLSSFGRELTRRKRFLGSCWKGFDDQNSHVVVLTIPGWRFCRQGGWNQAASWMHAGEISTLLRGPRAGKSLDLSAWASYCTAARKHLKSKSSPCNVARRDARG